MACKRLHKLYSGLLLLILLVAHTGQKIHIYNEDHRHFAAFCYDADGSDNGREQVVERCVVDEFGFFPSLEECGFLPRFYALLLAVLPSDATCSKLTGEVYYASLRAPPTAEVA